MNLTIGQGCELRIGSGRFRLSIDGRGCFLFRVPFVGKVWRYGQDHSGWSSWDEVREEHALGLDD